MNKSSSPVSTLAIGIVLICLPLSGFLAHQMDEARGPASIENALYLRSPRVIRAMSLGQTGLAADIYWTRTVQYFGDKHHQHALRYDLLYPMLMLTTELDPKLSVAYEFGSFFLAQKPPEGAGMPDAAVQFVERGIERNPDVWRLYYHLGFIHYMERKDCNAAASAFDRGSRVPGAHPWLKVMAASMAQKCGDEETARYFWSHVYDSTQDKSIKQNALVHLMAMRVDDEVMALESMAKKNKDKTGTFPKQWLELAQAGFLRGVPFDPGGKPYLLKPDGRVELQDYERFPFIHKGLPPGKTSSEFITSGAVKPQEEQVRPRVKP